ncbi:MAG: NAD-dependent DNA ligase LigA, partial [Tumebacillaceae bacterium]
MITNLQEQRMHELVALLSDYDYHYYTLDTPKVTDSEYDRLYDELRTLETETGVTLPNSPTISIGGPILFAPHKHLSRLWSLDKAQSHDELREWDKKVRKLIKEYNESNPETILPELTYILEQKFDGLTVNLTYENGWLRQAATRGK